MPDESVREARTFAAYLGCSAPPEAVVQYYATTVGAWALPADPFDAWLTRLARRSSRYAALADTYARRARPYGDLRRRLTLMLALLETHGSTHADYDGAHASGRAAAWAALAAYGVAWVARSVLAVALCAPVHAALGRQQQ